MISIHAEDFRDAYMKVNRAFIFEGPIDYERSGVTAHHQHNTMIIDHAVCDLRLDEIGYKSAKWGMITKLYFDPDAFGLMIARLKHYHSKNKRYMVHVAMQFRDRGNASGACLLAISLGYVENRGWELEVFTRASEVACRIVADFIFLSKIVEEIGKHLKINPYDIKVIWHAAGMYQSILFAPLFVAMDDKEQWMIDNEGVVLPNHWQIAIIKRYFRCYVGDKGYSYKSQVRAVNAYKNLYDDILPVVPNSVLLLPEYKVYMGDVGDEDDEGIFTKGGFK